MRLTSVVVTSWISSITSKISWIVGWPWSNHVCQMHTHTQTHTSVFECASVSVIVSTIWYMGRKNKYCFFCQEIWILAWRSHGKIMELFSEIFMGTQPGGCFTNISRALQNNLAKIYKARNNIYAENFKLKLCICAQSMALGTHTKFQLEILIRSTILVIYKFRENILD